MSYTIVTSFVLQRHDLSNTEKITDYLKRFEYIRNLKIPTILFLDKTLKIEESDTLKVVYTSIEETWIYNLYKNTALQLPSSRNTVKDTAEYMFIQNSKAEWIYQSSILNPFNTDYFVWVDFGLSHVIKNKDNFNILKNLKLTNDIVLSAIEKQSHPYLTTHICWRFAGGVFSIKGSHAKMFYEACKNVITQIFPRLTWEVNVWCFVEKMITISVYYANHDDTILTQFSLE